MKKTVFTIVLALTVSFATAQVEKGDINATTHFTYTAFDGSSLGIFFLKGGYLVSDHVEVGTSFQLFFAAGSTGVGAGPYGTYNFLTADGKLMPYAGAQLSILSFSGTSINSIGIYGGSKYFLTEAVNLDAGISLMQGFGDIDGLVFSATIGVGVVLGKLR